MTASSKAETGIAIGTAASAELAGLVAADLASIAQTSAACQRAAAPSSFWVSEADIRLIVGGAGSPAALALEMAGASMRRAASHAGRP